MFRMSSLLNRKLYSNSGDLKLPAAMSVLKEKNFKGEHPKRPTPRLGKANNVENPLVFFTICPRSCGE